MGTFIRLTDIVDKEKAFFDEKNRFHVSSQIFDKLDGKPYTYWMGSGTVKALTMDDTYDSHFNIKAGMCTGKNEAYILQWHEICFSEIYSLNNQYKYTLHNKGGEFCKWYGNQNLVLKYSSEALREMQKNKGFRHDGKEYYFSKHIGWTKISSTSPSFRLYDEKFTFDSAGLGLFPKNQENLFYHLGFLNSVLVKHFISLLNPTLNVTPMLIKKMPYCVENEKKIIEKVEQNVVLAKEDYDDFETSLSFRRHPLIGENTMGKLIRDIFLEYSDICESRFERVKQNEIDLNILFIDIYRLQNELSPVISDEEITLRKAEMEREIKSLLSYAVGCIMGRYSLKEDGLIYAGGEWVASRYANNFKPCEYGVMLITEEQYFEEDLCTRVIDFIEVVYGKDTLNENLNFIAQALKPGAKDSARKVIRDYLYDEKGFFDNHYQIYQHRPIYWMMSSGKNGGFRAIIYMHRYNQNTLSIVRSEFLHELRYKYEADHSLQHKKEVEAATTADRNDAIKMIASLDKKIVEVNQYDDLINHATGNITAFTFDLDDGVKINYGKFLNIDGVKTQNLLVPIKL